MWQYQKTDELYHYGVLGMKWGHRKSYGSLGANLAARIRSSQLKSTKSRISGDSKDVKKMNKYYEWMKKNQADIKKSGSKIGNSKILTSIRKARMNSLKKKIKTTNASIKEDHQIIKELNNYENAARKRAQNISRTKAAMQKAKAQFKADKKEYSKAYNKYAKPYNNLGILANVTKKQKARNKANADDMLNKAEKANASRKNYKKAKYAYKKAKI